MASRYEQREVVIQTLFESDFYNELNLTFAQDVLLRNCREFLLLEEVPEFARNLLAGTILKREVIDQIVGKAAPEWPIEKISFIDRSLLRLGIFELLFGQEYNVPPKVAINEAIELAKAFGGDNSRKFVNGVLGGIFKEMKVDTDEPAAAGKSKTVTEELVGGCLYKQVDGIWKVAFIVDLFKHYTWPKGHVEAGEDKREAMIKIAMREANIFCAPGEILGENSYIADSKDHILRKRVTYFMAEIVEEKSFIASESIVSLQFLSREDLDKFKIYKDMKPLVKKAFDILEGQN